MDLINLRSISFSSILKLKDQSIIPFYNYDYFKKLPNGHEISGYCTKCEENNLNKVSDKNLSLITYGTHTIDYIDYLIDPPLDRDDWHKDGVMFVFENPGEPWKKYGGHDSKEGMYRYCEELPYKKSPMLNSWSWIGWDKKKAQIDFAYPKCFHHKSYGALILSIILLFKLDNAYVTNAVKCGTESGDNTGKYCSKTVDMCVKTHLIKEIYALQPKLIFAFGKRTFNIIKKTSPNSKIIYLPHPASRGKTSNIRWSYSYEVLEALCEASVVKKDSEEYCKLIALFDC